MRTEVFVVLMLQPKGGGVVIAASDYTDRLPVYGVTQAKAALRDALNVSGGRIVRAQLEFEVGDALYVEDLATKFLEGKEMKA